MSLEPGTRLGPYEILSPLGAGGMGKVYRARDPKLARDVAVKVLPEGLARDAERLARFEREARALAALNHPGIVTIYSIEEADETRFLAMELVEGESLDAAIASGGPTLSRFFEIAVALADALSAAHERGIVHRDLKPANVMITPEGRVKVLDFGLARLEAPGSDPNATGMPTQSRAELTGEGQVFGTVAYMSPEQARGARVDARSDVFALGVVLYELLTGERPFQGASAVEVMSSILRDTPRPATDLRTDVPPHLARILRRCLEKGPRDRYQTSRDVFNELKDLRAETSAVSSAPSGRSAARAAASAPSGAVRAEEGFWVAVLPFQHRGSDPGVEALAEGMTDEIVTGLSRFSYLHVISRGSTARYASETADVREVGRQLGARYVLDGSLRQAGSALRVSVQLIDAVSGAHLWAETYSRPFRAEEIFALQDDLVPRIVSTIADMHGVLPRSMSEVLRHREPGTFGPDEAVLRSFGYYERLTAEEHAEVRDVLERAVRSAPDNADCLAMLSMMYSEEHKHGFNPGPDPLGRALEAARRAVVAAPSNHLAYHALAQALFFRRELPAFRNAADRAVALNPMDGDTTAFMGILMSYAGDWERGCALAERATQFNPNHPGWYWFAAVNNALRKKEYRAALDVALKLNLPSYFYTHAALAVAWGRLGEKEAAGREVRELLALKPDFASVARAELAKWMGEGEILETYMEGLRRAGLDVPAGAS
jgi:serine/threonine protein kinase/tetratricopeptide (TPR) repeat protein